jgi:hypothetical protein
MILETLKGFPIAIRLDTPSGFPKVWCLHSQGTFFKVQKLFLKTKKVFIVNHANGIACSLDWTIFDGNQKCFYEISTEPLFSQNHFWGFCLLPDRRTPKKVLQNFFFIFRVVRFSSKDQGEKLLTWSVWLGHNYLLYLPLR